MLTPPSFSSNQRTANVDGTINRSAVVVSESGNGVNYTVYIQNWGYFNAMCGTIDEIHVGDWVDVAIYNNLQEAF